mmetsp:Transcript_38262/g.91405  ORF Transcript_38262/g.91405 Transcript_38262/m.91405 type:complete len:221 (+) Transcript_38262:739-1401(+)
MISVVPTQDRAMVPVRLLATPKSISFTGVLPVSCWPHTNTFSALKSRCTTSLSCMNFSPAAHCLVTFFTASSGREFWPSLMNPASSPPSMSSITIMMYWAWEVPGRKASKQPRHSQMLGWPWIFSSTSVSLRMVLIFSSQEGSISRRQMGMVFTACFTLGVLLLWQRYTVPWPPTPRTLSTSIWKGSSGGPKVANCSMEPSACVTTRELRLVRVPLPRDR